MKFDLSLLPWDLRIEVSENLCRKDFTQAELAKIQRMLIEKIGEYTERGKRTNLHTQSSEEPTCTQNLVQVKTADSARRVNMTEKVARMFKESENTLRKRLALVQAAETGDEEAKRYVSQVDQGTATLSGAYNKFMRVVRRHDLSHADIRLPEGKFRVIYADPPWRYQNTSFATSAEAHYPTLSVPEICALPIPDLAAEDSILLLWATNPLLPEALEVIQAWGYTYKQNYVWVKDRVLPGFHHLSKHELLLVATRGSCLPTGKLVPSVIEAPRKEHSRKPELYGMIESLYPGPYLELFARNRENRTGWTFWGNEAKWATDCVTNISQSAENIAK